MKKLITIICFGILFFSSCKKSDVSSTSIVGTWELRGAQYGMTPGNQYGPGNGNLFKFSVLTYQKYKDGNLIKSGQYKLVHDPSAEAEVGLVIPAGQFTNRIVFDHDYSSQKTFIQISDNRLSFLSGYFPTDGGSGESYQRIDSN